MDEKITRSATDSQSKHIGNIRHGVQTGPWRVEFPAKVKVEAASYKIRQGSIVSLNANGEYVIGCPAGTGVNRPVPFISMKNIIDPDVMTGKQGTNMADSTYSAVGGIITAIPATAGYEMESTEFDATATYAVNDAVVPATGDKAGLITVATVAPGSTEPVVGFVTEPSRVDWFNNTRIGFLLHFIPAGIIPDYSEVTTAKTLTATNGALSWE